MVHIGIDVHLRESQICVLHEDGTLTQQRVATRPDRLAAVVGPLGPAQVLLEASGQSEWVAATLEDLGRGLTVIVADPNYAPMYPGRRRIKTDARDAEALAVASAKGTYRAVHRRSAGQRRMQAQLMVREQLVQTRTQLINVVRAALRGAGIRLPSGPTETLPTRVAATDAPLAVALVVAPLLEVLRHLTTVLATLDADLTGEARQAPAVRRLMGVPGVGPITALAFVATLDTPTRFPRAAQVASFLGLVPAERSSGDHQRRGHITKRGPRRVRWLLGQAAWCIWRSARPEVAGLRAWAQRLAARRGIHVALVALARRLATVLFAMWRDETAFGTPRRAPGLATPPVVPQS
jgi:transposase